MSNQKRFLVAAKSPTGAIELHPMKDWLRKHPDALPQGFHPDENTSHQLRNALRRHGWTVNITDSEARMIPPDVVNDQSAVSVLGELADETESAILDEQEQFEFSLESHLRDFLAKNISNLNLHSSRLRIFQDESGRSGIEYPTDVGPIDLLALDENQNPCVFELKLSRGPDRAMGQLLRYIGWVKSRLAGSKDVFGFIVAKDIDEKLRYAALPVPNVRLLEYEVNFQVKAAELK